METGIDNYEIQYKLPSGQFSEVYVVKKKKDLKRDYVLKIQKLSNKNKTQIQTIRDEAKILDSMKHPNIVCYHGSWEDHKSIYILMEYATRGTLRDLINSRMNPLIEKDAFYLFSQIVLGMRYIHSQQIIHRDIKPENIMLTGRNGDIVQIGDFGLSKYVHEFTHNAGSMSYCAPEIILGLPADVCSDIWSMGVVLYEMVTRRLPFPAEDYRTLSYKIKLEKPAPLNYGSSKELVSLVSKLLRKCTRRRANMGQLLLCPYLIPYMIKVHLNVGRGVDLLKTSPEKFRMQISKFFQEC